MQTRIESASWAVVAKPAAKVYAEPSLSAAVVGEREHGRVVSASLRSSGEGAGNDWVRLTDIIPASESGEGWMLIDGTTHGIGVQLHRKEFERSRLLKWYIANAEVEVRDEIKGTHIVGHREAGRLLRSDLEMSGWVRLTEDFRRPGRDGGEADVCEGWVSLNANDVTRWRPPAEAKGAPPESLPGKTHHFWVCLLYTSPSPRDS